MSKQQTYSTFALSSQIEGGPFTRKKIKKRGATPTKSFCRNFVCLYCIMSFFPGSDAYICTYDHKQLVYKICLCCISNYDICTFARRVVSRNFKTGGPAIRGVWRLSHIPYLFVVRVENEIHIVNTAC